MKVLRVVAAGLLAGALVGIVAALLRPRRRLSPDGYSPAIGLPDARLC